MNFRWLYEIPPDKAGEMATAVPAIPTTATKATAHRIFWKKQNQKCK